MGRGAAGDVDTKSDMAVRFQWFSDLVDKKDVANEPHSSIFSKTSTSSLDLTSSENKWVRESGSEALEEYNRILAPPILKGMRYAIDMDMSKRARETIARRRTRSIQKATGTYFS